MTIEELHREIDRTWTKHLKETRDLLRIPSVSMTGEGIEETAHEVSRMISDLGAKAKLFKGSKDGFPLVTGYLDVGSDLTGLLYGMYDVMPVGDLDEWDHPPFGAEIVKDKRFGEILVNRGVSNSKGSLAGTLLAIRTMVDHGQMPMNLHFMIEGEEEKGGQSLPKYVHANKGMLSKADVAWALDYCENANGVPVVQLGMKGCVYLELEAKGSEKGGPMEGEIHSSDAVWVQSPAWRLVQALSTLVDEEQEVAVDGLWDDVAPPGEADLKLIKKLAKRIDLEEYASEIGIKRFKFTGPKEEMIRRYLFEPSLNINGIVSGYIEEGTKTVLPPKAMAKIDVRTVPNMTIEGTRKRVTEHLRKRGFTDITIRNFEDYPWCKVSSDDVASRACIEAMRYHGKDPEVWPMTAGSAPLYLFDQVLGVPWCYAGLGHGGRAHAPNEYAVVSGMKDFEKSVVTMMWKYAALSHGTSTRKSR